MVGLKVHLFLNALVVFWSFVESQDCSGCTISNSNWKPISVCEGNGECFENAMCEWDDGFFSILSKAKCIDKTILYAAKEQGM